MALFPPPALAGSLPPLSAVAPPRTLPPSAAVPLLPASLDRAPPVAVLVPPLPSALVPPAAPLRADEVQPAPTRPAAIMTFASTTRRAGRLMNALADEVGPR